jgi:hypothetical protein
MLGIFNLTLTALPSFPTCHFAITWGWSSHLSSFSVLGVPGDGSSQASVPEKKEWAVLQPWQQK